MVEAGTIVWLGACYVIGSLSPGTVLVRWRLGVDVRDLGSGGAGGTNVAKAVGWWGMPLVGLLDAGKAAAMVWWGAGMGVPIELLGAGAVMLVLGNVLPMQQGWRGGKGVATSLGALAVIAPEAAGWLLLVGGIAGGASRDRMAGGAIAYGVLPLAGLLGGQGAWTAIWLGAIGLTVRWALDRPRRTQPEGGDVA